MMPGDEEAILQPNGVEQAVGRSLTADHLVEKIQALRLSCVRE